MSIELNWQPIFGAILLTGAAATWGWQAWRSWRSAQVSDPLTVKRLADEPPPVGAVEWVQDICGAMSGAEAESVVVCLRAGATRDQAKSARIAELEVTT